MTDVVKEESLDKLAVAFSTAPPVGHLSYSTVHPPKATVINAQVLSRYRTVRKL